MLVLHSKVAVDVPGERTVILAGTTGELKLSIVRREHPADDWLVVHGAVDTSRGAWTFDAPCFEIGEIPELANWLRRVARGEVGENGRLLEFTEPTLAFEFVTIEGEVATIRVLFGHEALPPFARQFEDYGPNEEFEPEPVVFVIRRDDLRAAAARIEDDLARILGAQP